MTALPTEQDILNWISENPHKSSKRDIARAFGVKGSDKIILKKTLKSLAESGSLVKTKSKTYRKAGVLPPVTLVQITHVSDQGDLFGQPQDWTDEAPAPEILIVTRRSDPSLGAGDKALMRLQAVDDEAYQYEGRLIRRLSSTGTTSVGILRVFEHEARLKPVDRSGKEWIVSLRETLGAKDGELVEVEKKGGRSHLGLPRARVTAVLGDPSAAKSVSLIAIHQHDIPHVFPDEVLSEAEHAREPELGARTDLRHIPFITIDPHDARDHDDACFAESDQEQGDNGGYILWVAIADVAHYVTSQSNLDREALKRGNSTYFADRVVPMLPERLSNGLCSLKEGEDRYALVAKMRIDQNGALLSQTFLRAVIRSHASLSYETVQAARDGQADLVSADILEKVITPLYEAYQCLLRAREKRQPLELDLPERQIVLDDLGRVSSINYQERLEAHKLIEEFMVLANVAASLALVEKRTPLLFRVHEEPSPEKIDALRKTAQASGYALPKGQVLKTSQLNRLLCEAASGDFAELINMTTLRSMTQAYYSPKNFGHFGLALGSYAHFTSPIRRYADLIVHRALIRAFGWGEDGLSEADITALDTTAEAISNTERRSMVAERDTNDRYLAAYLSEQIGTAFRGRISGIVKFGCFVRLDDSGAEGLVPIRSIGREYFHYDRDDNSLMGSESGLEITLGQPVTVKLTETLSESGSITFELLELDGKDLSSHARQARSGKRSQRRQNGKRKPRKLLKSNRKRRH